MAFDFLNMTFRSFIYIQHLLRNPIQQGFCFLVFLMNLGFPQPLLNAFLSLGIQLGFQGSVLFLESGILCGGIGKSNIELFQLDVKRDTDY